MIGSPKRPYEEEVKEPNKRAKTQVIIRPVQSNLHLLPDLIRQTVSLLPAYCFVGDKSVHLIFSGMNTPEFKNDPVVKSKKSKRALLQSCQTPEDALNILSDKVLWDHMGYDERLITAGMHPEIVQKIFADPAIVAELKQWGWDFAFLAHRNPGLANFILDDKSLYETMRGDAFAFMGQGDVTIARRIFNQFRNALKTWHMPKLGAVHLEIAHLVLDNTTLLRNELISLGEYHVEIARRIFREFRLNIQLNTDDKFLFACHPELRLELKEKIVFTGDDLLLAQHDAAMAQECLTKILGNPERLVEIKAHDLITLSYQHVEIAKQILAHPVLRDKLYGDDLAQFGKYHVEIAEQILADDQLKLRLGGHVHILGRQHVKIARKIIAIDYESLNGDQLTDLCRRHTSIALQVFADQNLLRKLSTTNTKSLGISCVAIAEKILENEALHSKIDDNDDLYSLRRSVFISKRIREIVDEVRCAKKSLLKLT